MPYGRPAIDAAFTAPQDGTPVPEHPPGIPTRNRSPAPRPDATTISLDTMPHDAYDCGAVVP